jgi:glycerol kinase
MERDTRSRLSELRVDGGAAASALLMQFQADLLGVRVSRPANLETTALGAALLAGLAVGVWRGESDLSAVRTAERTFAPRMRRAERERRRRLWHRAVARARGWESA